MRLVLLASTLLIASLLAGCSDDGESSTTTIDTSAETAGQLLPTCDDLDLGAIGSLLGSDSLADDPAAPGTRCAAGDVSVELIDNPTEAAAAAALEAAPGMVVDGLADQARLDEAGGRLLVQSSTLTVSVVAPGADGDALVGAFELVASNL